MARFSWNKSMGCRCRYGGAISQTVRVKEKMMVQCMFRWPVIYYHRNILFRHWAHHQPDAMDVVSLQRSDLRDVNKICDLTLGHCILLIVILKRSHSIYI